MLKGQEGVSHAAAATVSETWAADGSLSILSYCAVMDLAELREQFVSLR